MGLVGLVHTYILPMLPMIMVFIMAVSWVTLFLEAAIAGVLWAFAFIRMDGQDFFDKNQSPGVTLVFNLFLRPALSMLAFIGGIILLPELLNALNLIWDESYDAQVITPDYNFILGIIKYFVGLLLFTYMQWHLSMRIFGLIPTISDRVGHWMGFGSTQGYGDGRETDDMNRVMMGGVIVAGNKGAAHMPGMSGPKPKSGGKGGGDGDGGGDNGGGGGGSPGKVNAAKGGLDQVASSGSSGGGSTAAAGGAASTASSGAATSAGASGAGAAAAGGAAKGAAAGPAGAAAGAALGIAAASKNTKE